METADGASTSKVVTAVHAWLAEIKAKLGVEGIIYSASGFWNTLPSTSQFASNTLWVANYGASCPSMPSTWSHWAVWQYSESGSVPGVSGGIDLDEFNGTLADLQKLTVPAAPPPPPPGGCATDADCNEGASGTGLVCSNAAPIAGQCIKGCHVDKDCPSGEICDETKSPWQCEASAPPPPPPPACPVLAFPSGIHIQTVENAAMTASYANHLSAGQTAPKCFLDVTHLHDPVANATYDMSVHVATNFELSELVGTEVSQGWGNFVLLSPSAVAALQQFRVDVGGAGVGQ